ncbi:MAG: RsmE family RNA methyltransferase, partial [Chitinivibrionales bacterium]|nr:RsmE family RNA methyltransferase [Chitinivibrionales bacterium]MBD3358600.1 RsmE family RNA methyltransferase [Chitinivibrionales bacterium]
MLSMRRRNCKWDSQANYSGIGEMRNAEHFLFYREDLSNDIVELEGAEARHAVTALRCRPGDGIRMTDGRGILARCEMEFCSTNQCRGRVVERIKTESPAPAVHLMVGLPERDAFERLIENVTPLGVRSITPLICGRCQRKWWAKGWERYRDRLHRKMVAGIKQAQSAWLPH